VLQLALDVTDEQACRDAVARTQQELGSLDVLVNNAGVMLLGTIVGADPDDWRRMISANVLGLMYMTHAAIDGLIRGLDISLLPPRCRAPRPYCRKSPGLHRSGRHPH